MIPIFVQIYKPNVWQNYLYDRWGENGLWAFSPYALEIPTWMPRLASMLGRKPESSLWMTPEGAEDYRGWSDETVFGSVMDIFKPSWEKMIANNPCVQFVLGGYTKPITAPNVTWLNSVTQLKSPLQKPYNGYEMFRDRKCIPRLGFTTGCPWVCTFCTIERGVKRRLQSEIDADIDALEPLQFRHVYVDDKTFGIGAGLDDLLRARQRFAAKGHSNVSFIIQTTAAMGVRLLVELDRLGAASLLAGMEVGIETMDLNQRGAWRKPDTAQDIENLMGEVAYWKLGHEGLFVPNIITAYPGCNYDATVDWMQRESSLIDFANVYRLSGYESGQKGSVASGAADSDETNPRKSWLSEAEVRATEDFEQWVRETF